MFVRSFDTKSARRICRKLFDVESYMDIRTDIVYRYIGYDVIICYRSEVIWEKQSGGISRERFKVGSRNFTSLSRTSGHTNLPEMASPAPSGWLQNATKYYRKAQNGSECRKMLLTRKRCETRQKISVLQRQGRLQIYRVKNIGRVFELSGVAFRPVPPYGWLLVELFSGLQNRCRPLARPSARPDNDDNYRSRSYRFVERKKITRILQRNTAVSRRTTKTTQQLTQKQGRHHNGDQVARRPPHDVYNLW